ncbi:FAD-dependent oxidoreductase [Nocardioides sp. JQ2195]|uniref:FAD-dependent oxidoreductase n=1 Tax=Nocardioides sp. JQ2195 TaxID=2592334 RepID=UPI00197FFB86|nr:FAD-dependent oxidoreductase [Nocardioides sp. JQ2195]
MTSTTDGDLAWDVEVDVVVLGMGAAGSAAAIEAHEAGCSVIVLEKMPPGREGGNTRVSGGAWWHNVDPERAAVYLRSLCGDYPVSEPVVKAWAEETSHNTEWVEKKLGVTTDQVRGAFEDGAGMPVEFPELEGSDVYGGQIAVDGKLGNSRLFKALARGLEERGIDVRMATPAKTLVQDPHTSEVIGVEATAKDGSPLRIAARRGVVLATGGFEANPHMVRDFLRLPHSVQWGSPGNTGDGHKMAMKAGADLWHMDNMMAIEGLRVPGHESGMYARFSFRQGFIHVDTDGKRCVDELPRTGHGTAWVNGQYEHVPQRRVHVVFDEATRLSGPISPNPDMLPVGWSLLVDGYAWSADNSVEIDNGWIHRGETLEELAEKIEVNPDVLVRTVARWNAACANGEDEQFGRRADTLEALGEGPYYAFTSGPMLGWTNGGPRRDENCRVLDPFGEPIPGLFAAGSVSSTYSWGKDGGFHIGDALAFGRIAGRNASTRTAMTGQAGQPTHAGGSR